MGAGASVDQNAMTALNHQSAKPLDASDVNNLYTARQEIAYARQQAHYYRNLSLPRYACDTTGDGRPNAIGYDTTGNGQVDSFDTTGDGFIDTILVIQNGNYFFSSVARTAAVTQTAQSGQDATRPAQAASGGLSPVDGVVIGAMVVTSLPAGAAATVVNGALVTGGAAASAMGGFAANTAGMVSNSGALSSIGSGAAIVGSTISNGFDAGTGMVVQGANGVMNSDVYAGAAVGASVVGSTVSNGFDAGTGMVVQGANGVMDSSMVAGVSSAGGAMVDNTGKTASLVAGAMAGTGTALASGAGAMAEHSEGFFEGAIHAIENVGGGALEAVAEAAGGVVNVVGSVAGAVGEAAGAVVGVVKSVV